MFVCVYVYTMHMCVCISNLFSTRQAAIFPSDHEALTLTLRGKCSMACITTLLTSDTKSTSCNNMEYKYQIDSDMSQARMCVCVLSM